MEAVASDIALMRRTEAALTEAIENKSNALLGGVAADYAEYRGWAGEIRGLRAALESMRAIADQMMGKTEGNNG